MPRCVLLILAFLSISSCACATEVRIAFPAAYGDDIFVKTLLSSKALAEAGLSLAPQELLSESEAKRAVDTGAADMSIYTFVPENLSKFTTARPETSLLTRPFMFKSTEEVLQAQKSFIGDAAANAVGRSGLFPLKLWNHGITYFLSKEKITSAADFAKLTVAAENGAPDVKILSAVGCRVVDRMPGARAGAANAMQTRLSAATADFAKNYNGKLYLTTGWPMTGLLVAAHDFWLQRSEAEKKALGLAVQEARQASDAEIMARRDAIARIPNVEMTNLATHEQVQLALNSIGDAPDELSRELSLWRKAEVKDRAKAAPAPASPPPPKMATRSPVLFATDRDDEGTQDYTTRFGSRRLDPFEFTCGYLGSPQRHSGEPHLPPAPKTLIKGAEACAREIVARTRASGSEKILIVIHGFNIPFDGLAWRALQVGSDVDYDGAILGWSWPSEGSTFGYAYDEDSSVWSEPHLVELVNDIAEAGPELQLDFVAHSMGNRMLLQMLRDFALFKTKLRIGAAVFAAPDVAQDVFREQIRVAGALGRIRTLYASEYDRAILISESYHGSPRAGSGGADILVTGGIESVDARLSGHSYVFDDPKAIQDMREVLNKAMVAVARGLPEREKAGEPYWLIQP